MTTSAEQGKRPDSDGGNNNHNHVYVRSKEEAWVPARLLQVKGNEATVQVGVSRAGQRSSSSFDRWTINLADYPNHALPLQNCNARGTLQPVPDMIELPHLHEAAILYNLKARHANKQPYTRTGDIVIAVNPYEWMNHYYTKERRAEYTQALIHNNRPVQELAPHVYEASALAYKGLLYQQCNQSILVSGESGAGKTETVKIALSHIASISDNQDSTVVQRILDSNPLLEAFGNAKTTRNDNSSRFGKYLSLQFDSNTKLAGSQCQTYLLEKSRVVHHVYEERTYHIFYQLLAAPESTKAAIWKGLAGKTTNASFKYVGFTTTDTIEGVTDADRFQQTVDGLELLGVRGPTLLQLWRSLCAVLQLGNLTFARHPVDSECAIVEDSAELYRLAELLGLSPSDLHKALMERKIEARGEIMTAAVSSDKAKDACDALAKEIYHRAFSWLVRRINEATSFTATTSSGATAINTIGLLDIFGFESFETNGFEQLCINYANEKLQQKFTQDIFTSVMAEYQFEGIKLEEITYDDNTDVLDLIEGKTGLLAMLNEECFRPKGSDTTFVHKAIVQNKSSPCLIVEHMFDQFEFGIRHYAGNVVYHAGAFVSKNSDNIPNDLKDMATNSSNEIIASLSEQSSKDDEQSSNSRYKSRTTRRDYRRKSSNIVGETVWGKFKTQLNELMGELESTQTRYIRCIKPNSSKAPRIMEHVTTIEQLRCAGVVAAVTISRSAFPNRLEHEHVLERFRSLWPKGVEMCNEGSTDEQNRANVDILLTGALEELKTEKKNKIVKAFVTGRTRTYFRAGALEFLDAQRLDGMAFWATEIQRVYRGVQQRRLYKQKRAASIQIESCMRRSLERRRFLKLRECTIVLQCWHRVNTAKMILADKKEQCTAATEIQRMARGKLQRRRYRKALQEKKDEANMLLQMEKMRKQIEEAERKRQEELEQERELARRKMEADRLALLEVEQKRMEEEKVRLLEEERKRTQKLEEMQRLLEEAERRRQEELEQERELARQQVEAEKLAMLEAERKRMEEATTRSIEEECKHVQEKEALQKQLEEAEKRFQVELERERELARQQAESEKMAMLEAEQKRVEEVQARLFRVECLKKQEKEEMQKQLEQAEKRRQELKRERKSALAKMEAEKLAMQEVQQQLLEEEKTRFLELESARMQEKEEMQKQLENSEKRRQEELELVQQKFEAEKLAMEQAQQKQMEEESARKLEEDRNRKQEIEALQNQLELAEQQRQQQELERKLEKERHQLENEERAKLETERKNLEDEKNRSLAEDRENMEEELSNLRSQNQELQRKHEAAEQKAFELASLPPPEPEVKIVEVVKIVEKEIKPKGPIMTEEQKALMQESGKIIEFLRNENIKLKKKTEQQKKDFDTIKASNEQLMEANASASQSFQSLNQHAKQLNGTNQRLTKTVAQYRHKIGELHSEIKNRQTYYREIADAYKAESDTRVFYEQAMLEIVDSVSANHCDPSIHSLVMAKAMECAKMSNKVAGNPPEMDEVEETESSLLEL